MNLLDRLTPETLAARGFAWEHPPAWEPLPGGGVRVAVPPGVDYFRDPAREFVRDNGPFLWRAATGDFVARLHVRPVFASMYDAGGILVRQDEGHWAKLCFESTHFGTNAAISVVTQELSDDANGVDLEAPEVWLQVCRVGEVLGMHYALDGATWRKVRRFRLPLPSRVQVGLMAQSPGASGTRVDCLHFSLEARTVGNMRAGV